MQVVTSPVGLADFCPNQADRRDRAAASFWTVRLLGGLPGFLWCATNAAAICGHIVAHSGVRYSTQDKLFQPCCHPRLWAPSAHVFTAANADTAFFGVFPNLLHQSGQNKSQRDVFCYAQNIVFSLPFCQYVVTLLTNTILHYISTEGVLEDRLPMITIVM